MTTTATPEVLHTDVLVVGGGPAGTWAALKAAENGASVVLADKGYCGSSGATAAAGTGVWYVPPEPDAREVAMASREALGGFLADRRWMARVLDETYHRMNELADKGRYPFPVADDGTSIRTGVQGPEYMRRQRLRIVRAGVRVLDHTPVQELTLDDSGAVAGGLALGLDTGARVDIRAGRRCSPAGVVRSYRARSAATSIPATGHCSQRRPARSSRGWSSPTLMR